MDLQRLSAGNRIFDAVLDLPAAERETRIAELCGGDAELVQLVQRLLARITEPDAALDAAPQEQPAWRDALTRLAHAPTLADGEQIGAYRMLRRLGHGGSAEVYLAERRQGGVLQQVAIKLMLADVADTVTLARFRQEQQILARLSHPNIGKIFDVGLSNEGRPYFVMEYVDGEPIDQYCDRQGLDLRARLRLLVRVAEAVAHAHGELVVHRDIKPSNVLVDVRGEPRLVDFGIAKIIDSSRIDVELTLPGTAPATLGYASPEQLSGKPVGVASDVYQLGMLAYVLLAGQRPYATRGLSGDEAALLAQDAQRTPPSRKLRDLLRGGERERVAAIAGQRRMKIDQLLRGLAGDLDEVVLKAIAVDPADRYASVPQLADDLRHVLQGRPVSARAPSMWYVFSRTLRRHAFLSALSGVLLLGLIAFSVAITSLAFRLDDARKRAEQQSLLAEQVTDFLVSSFRASEPQHAGGRDSLVRKALDRAAEAPPTRFVDDDAFNARLHLVLGTSYESIHEYDLAGREFERTLQRARTLPAAERNYAELQAYNGLGRVALRMAKPEDALEHFSRVLARTADDDSTRAAHVAALANTAVAHASLGDREAALGANARASSAAAEIYGPDHLQRVRLRLSRAQLLSELGRYDGRARLEEAERISADLAAGVERTLGKEDPVGQIIRLLHPRVLSYLGRHEEAIAGLRAALPDAAQVMGLNDLVVLNARRMLGLSLAASGQVEAGVAELDAVIAGYLERYGQRHPDLLRARFDRAVIFANAGRDTEAVAALEGADLEFLMHEPRLQRLQREAQRRNVTPN
jgi:eukaryotic-like serine/threonine-protein kinase